ncbi:electron transfer flavoprotein subunit alpha/FixB family protein [uncultured Ellagibacter sp.]|uniref:electron transfer flavoprotein subunit alpha/FixB family protein n=1 Tax=uncultured Ellagibacter sp. TaxID=2137580 RepID=UPI00262FDDCB|nr:electron transfer flavoprotein subunit alpha/FixB family protein [uncultured Ellagibacter sp.]
MKALVIAENGDAARFLAAGARSLADQVVLAFLGDAPLGIADKAYSIKVPENAVVDDAYLTVKSRYDIESPDVVLAEPTRHVKSVVGRLAAYADTAVITDATAFAGEAAKSLYFGGVGERVRKNSGPIGFYTMDPNLFQDADISGTDVVEELAWITPERSLTLVSSRKRDKSGEDLSKADVVVAAGRGFAEESDLELARNLADKLGGALACSRPLTEGVSWLPSDTYIGVSGLMLAPKIYVACGISGQMQHMVGCNRSGTIFAINKDKNAPIFKQCDLGLVGDVKNVIPAIVAAL